MPYGVSIWGPMVASAVGGYFANKSSSSQSPTMDPRYGPLQQQILAMIQQRLQSGGPDMSGYRSSGVANINRTYDLVRGTQENDLTRRGLATSPVAANVDTVRGNARATDTSKFLNSIPLLQRQLQNEDLGMGANLLGLGRGTTSSLETGGGLAGGATNLAAYFGYLQGKGAFLKPAGGGIGPGVGGYSAGAF